MAYEHDRRIIVYPNYLDNRKTVAQGRRIPKELACEAPNALEIYDCVTKGLKLEAEAEMKSYPRDWMVPGRVRVKLRDDAGAPLNPDIPNRRTLLIKIAELVPRHPTRVNGRPAAIAAAAEKQQQAAASAAAGSSKQQQKKKGKKK